MSNTAQRKLLQQLHKIKKNGAEGIDAVPDEDNLYLWDAIMEGPLDTIWEGGTFRLHIQFGPQYPNKAPLIQFKSKMFHPNIYPDGKICIDTLQSKWSHMIGVLSLLTSIRSLLADPNPQSPANQEAAKVFMQDKVLYVLRVKQTVENSWKCHITL